MKRFLGPLSLAIILLALPNSSFSGFFRPGKAVVKLGGRVMVLSKETSCKATHWGPKEGCRCCILKHALKRDGTFNTTGDYIKTCIKKDRCSRASVEELAKELKIAGEQVFQEGDLALRTSGGIRGDGEVVSRIVEAARAISPVKTYAHSDDMSGNLSPEGVKSALKGLIEEPKDMINEMVVKPFGSGGAQTDQLFGVFQYEGDNKKKLRLKYIVKGLKKISESRNLEELKRDFREYSLSNSEKSKDFLAFFPAIAMSFGTTYYKDSKGKKHYITVMPAAPGKPLHDISESFVRDFYLPYQKYRKHVDQGLIKENEETEAEYAGALKETTRAFAVLGDRLGRFHATGMTVDKKGNLTGFSHNVHGDFHSNNVFYGKIDEQEAITFIDPETLVISFRKPRDVARDLRHFYLYLTLHFKKGQNVARLVSDKGFWHEQFIKSFLMAYVGGYGPYTIGNRTIKPLASWKIDALKIVERSLLSVTGSSEDVGQSIGAIPFGFWSHQRKELKKIFQDIRSHYANS